MCHDRKIFVVYNVNTLKFENQNLQRKQGLNPRVFLLYSGIPSKCESSKFEIFGLIQRKCVTSAHLLYGYITVALERGSSCF